MIAIIDYGAGNVASVANVLDKLDHNYIITAKEFEICNADKVIFPGVGEASFAVKQLHKLNLFTVLRIIKKPMLGICLGIQLMSEFSEEGNVTCLGILPGRSIMFDNKLVKVPHMGWNSIEILKESKLFNGIKNGEHFYFAHSYYIPPNEYAASISDNKIKFTASMEKENYYGVQFHPEKSGEAGIQILKNFLLL